LLIDSAEGFPTLLVKGMALGIRIMRLLQRKLR
jgi:hypothetical protein